MQENSELNQKCLQLFDSKQIKEFVVEWNLKFPIDKWWRQKNKVAFNTRDHRDVSFIDIRFEYEEEKAYNELMDKGRYNPNSGNWINVEEKVDNLTDEEKIEKFKKEFDSIDLSQYDD